MNETLSSNRSRFTPRRKTVETTAQNRLPLSLLLLGVGAALALAVTSWLGFFSDGKDVSLQIKEVKKAQTGEVQLTGARYRGLNPSGKPFEITAALANEATDGSGWVDMDQPTATFTMQNGSKVRLRSNTGLFNKLSDIVKMSGAVVVTQPDRDLRLDTEALEANLKKGEMQSNVTVRVQDIDRRIDADSMRVFDNGSRIIFGGTTKMIIRDGQSITKPQLSPF